MQSYQYAPVNYICDSMIQIYVLKLHANPHLR
jgi:hypothetical protein